MQVLRKRPIAGEGAHQGGNDDSRDTSLKEGWVFRCGPRFGKKAAAGFVRVTLPGWLLQQQQFVICGRYS